MTMSGPLPLPLHCPSHHDHSYQSGQSLVRCGQHHYHWSLHLILGIIIQWSALSKEDIQNNHCFMLKYLKHEISIFFEGERSVSTYLKFLLPSKFFFWIFFMASPVKNFLIWYHQNQDCSCSQRISFKEKWQQYQVGWLCCNWGAYFNVSCLISWCQEPGLFIASNSELMITTENES